MSKYAVDSDGLIKLAKAEVLGKFFDIHDVIVPAAVYEEVVVRGSLELHADAFVIDQLMSARNIPVYASQAHQQAEQLVADRQSLGRGEIAALRLYFTEGANAILSDDRAFVRLLRQESIPVLTPEEAIVGMLHGGHLDARQALSALDRLRPYIRDDAYHRARADVEARKGGSEGHGH